MTATLQTLTDVVRDAIATVRESKGDDFPFPSDWEELVREVYTDRGGNLRRRKSMRKTASESARSLAGIMRWHFSGGTLDGYMIARFRVTEERFEEIENLGVILVQLTAGGSPAVNRWQRALYGS